MSASKKRRNRHSNRAFGAEGDDLVVRKVTVKELTELDELSARLTTLIEMLDEKGILNKKEYGRMVAMRLHEISKAEAIEELDEEL